LHWSLRVFQNFVLLSEEGLYCLIDVLYCHSPPPTSPALDAGKIRADRWSQKTADYQAPCGIIRPGIS
jgi:hypothetical protein